MTGGGESQAERELVLWRRLVLDRVLVLFAVVLVIATLTTLRNEWAQGTFVWARIAPGCVVVAWAALARRAPFRYRYAALVLGTSTAIVGSLLEAAFLLPNPWVAQLLLVVLMALLAGRRAAWAAWGLGMALIVAVGAVFSSGLSAADPVIADPAVGANWTRVTVVYGALSATTVAAVTYLVENMDGAVRRAEALYRALTRESSERIAAIEEQRSLEAQLRQSQKLEALGTLAGGVAHDFNNLLVVILNYAEMCGEEDVPDEVRRQLAQIREAGEKAAALTRQLLVFGRRQVAERSAIHVNVGLERTLSMLRRLLPASVVVDYRAGASVGAIWAADIELDQVVMNLCVNARDAMPDGGRLSIVTERWQAPADDGAPARDFVRIRVGDTGVGMDEATRERIFEPFFTTKGVGNGTGLGMSTVHGIIEQMGGFIHVESAPGEGTRIDVHIPTYEGTPEARGDTAWVRRQGDETILVVDDDRGVREALVLQLQRSGYQTIACSNGEEALEAFRRSRDLIDLVVCDAVMPGMSGRDVHRAIAEEFGEVPFLICSGYAAEALSSTFFESPLRGFLAKPFDSRALQTQVRRLLDRAVGSREESSRELSFAER